MKFGIFSTGLLVGLSLSWLLLSLFNKSPELTIIYRLSPDNNLVVKLIEISESDSTFKLELKTVNIIKDGDNIIKAEEPQIIFQSGYEDEEGGLGTERIIWSSDSSRFILVGKHFKVWNIGNDVFIPTNEYIYLMYEVTSGQLLCNTYQPQWCDVGPKPSNKNPPATISNEPVITLDDLLQYEWESPLIKACPIPSPAKK